MSDTDVWLPPDPSNLIPEPRVGNDVTLFYDDRKLFAAMLADLWTATRKEDFVYMTNWWCDVDVPLGDPKERPPPPLLRTVLERITRPTSDNPPIPALFPGVEPGAQVCAMFWHHKQQPSLGDALGFPASIFGGSFLSRVNGEARDTINALSARCRAILDTDHAAFGSHHQKILLIRNASGLIAYVGSADFNVDRIATAGDGPFRNPTSGKNNPQHDVQARLVGQAAQDVLEIFVQRWKRHFEGKTHVLIGEGYTVQAISNGNSTVQLSTTYAKGYPYQSHIKGAASALTQLIKSAKHYFYCEDQYLIGTDALGRLLEDKLIDNINFHVICVMTSEAACDLPKSAARRNEFWYPLMHIYRERVLVFEMLNDKRNDTGPGSYLHAKVVLVDDAAASIGSVNFSNRSWYHDSEITAVVGGEASDDAEPRAIAKRFRLARWSRHLGVDAKEIDNIQDAIHRWKELPRRALVRPWTAGPKGFQTRAMRAAFFSAVDPGKP